MNARTLLLILILAIVAGWLFILANGMNKSKGKPSQLSPTPVVTKRAENKISDTTFLFIFPQASGSARKVNLVAVAVDTKDKIRGVDLEVSYDPNMIGSIQVDPGGFFGNANVTANTVDAKNGRISYGLQEDTAISGMGTVAIISFTQLKTASGGAQTSLSYLPETKVVTQKMQRSGVKEARDVVIPLGNRR